MADKINPDYYTNKCSISCIDAMKIAFGTDKVYTFARLNAFKYLWRYKYKGGLDDLEKARKYIAIAKEICTDDQLLEMDDAIKRCWKSYCKADEGYME